MRKVWPFVGLFFMCLTFLNPDLSQASENAVGPADVWLWQDFDSPMTVAGQMTEAGVEPGSLVPGRTPESGNAYRFSRARSNKLTPEQAAGAQIELKSKSVWTLESPFTVQSSHVTPKTAITFSGYVAPDPALKGKIIRLSVLTFEPDEKAKQKLDKQLEGNADARRAFVPDEPQPQEIELTGKQQRIAAYCIVDNRLANRVVKITMEQAADEPSRNPISLKLTRLMLEQTHNYPHFTFAPSVWVDGLRNAGQNSLLIRDVKLIESFPVESGTVAFWYRAVQDSNLTNDQHGFFSLKRGWVPDGFYLFNGNGTAGIKTAVQFTPIPDWKEANNDSAADSNSGAGPGWTHLILSWDADEVRLYQDGKRLSTGKRDVKALPEPMDKYSLRIGGTSPEGISAACDMDDFLILRRSLDDSQAEQFFANSVAGSGIEFPVLASGLDRTTYFRNESSARLVLNVFVRKPQSVKVETEAGTVKLSEQTFDLKAGNNQISVPFCPAELGAGDFPVRITGRSVELGLDAPAAFVQNSEIRVLPRLDRDEFKFLSWGGMNATSAEYCKAAGINSVNVNWDNPQQIESLTRAGLFVNIRVENSRIFSANGYDLAEVERQTRTRLAPYRNYYNWKATLVNSEVYGSGILKDLERNAKWTAWAQQALNESIGKQLGRSVELKFDQTHAPAEIPYYRDHPVPSEGIIDESDTLLTLDWFMNSGMPPYQCNQLTRDLVRELQPDNIVWSEPCMSVGMFEHLDMAADWMYAYDLADFFRELKRSWATVQTENKKFMPTATMGYWPVLTGKIPVAEAASLESAKTDAANSAEAKPDEAKPAETKSITINATVDDLKIKTALCLAAVPAEALSFFSVDSWSANEPEYLSQGQEAKGTVEPKSGERFGQFVRSDLKPMANLLRNVPMVRAQTPIAVVLSESTGYYSGLWWGQYHYTTAILHALGESGLDYDIIYDRQMEVTRLKQYKLVLFPTGKIVTRKNYEILKAVDASPETLLVVDKYCSQNYPNAVKMDDLYYDFPNREKATIEPVKRLLTEQWSKLTDGLPLLADGIAGDPRQSESPLQTNVLRFLREQNGIQYAVVINNARTTGAFNAYMPDKDWYRPYGAPQKITTRIKIADGAQPTIYAFPAMKPVEYQLLNGYAVVTEDFAPAQTRIYCVYPKPLGEVKATVNKAESRIELEQKYSDGSPLNGRQVVQIQVCDPDGIQRDESGLYVLENGKGIAPLYGSTEVTVRIQ